MEPLIPLVTVAPPAWLWLATNAVSGVVFWASVAALGATVAERDASWLSVVRGTFVFGAGLLVGLALFGWLSRSGLTLSCLGLLVSLEAVVLAFGRRPSLESHARCRATGEDPAWWTEFERGFRRYTIGGAREQNPLRRAVTRQADAVRDEPERPPAEPKPAAPGWRQS